MFSHQRNNSTLNFIEREREKHLKMSTKLKMGLVDSIIEKMPEIHITGYSYCGCNTKLDARLDTNGAACINKLDCACLEHDIAYTESDDLKIRYIADKILLLKAVRRVYAKDSRIAERLAALLVSGLIGIKMFVSKMEICICKIGNCVAVKRE